jgi:hypothetical protein
MNLQLRAIETPDLERRLVKVEKLLPKTTCRREVQKRGSIFSDEMPDSHEGTYASEGLSISLSRANVLLADYLYFGDSMLEALSMRSNAHVRSSGQSPRTAEQYDLCRGFRVKS